jgi:hypothetical protein
MSDTKNPPPGGVAPRYRMTPAEYQVMERSLSPPRVDKSTTELEAGYKLGVADCLRYLREHHVGG